MNFYYYDKFFHDGGYRRSPKTSWVSKRETV